MILAYPNIDMARRVFKVFYVDDRMRGPVKIRGILRSYIADILEGYIEFYMLVLYFVLIIPLNTTACNNTKFIH